MLTLIWIILGAFGGLFVIKLAYVLSTVLVLPTTRGALYVSTSRVRIAAFLEAVPMTAAQFLVDLGCGDGRVLRMAQKRYGVRAAGYELNPLAYVKAKLLCMGRSNIQVFRSSFWDADLSDADVIFCYLFPDVMTQLSLKLQGELKPGALIVSCNFPLHGFLPQKVLRPQHAVHNDPIYIYKSE